MSVEAQVTVHYREAPTKRTPLHAQLSLREGEKIQSPAEEGATVLESDGLLQRFQMRVSRADRSADRCRPMQMSRDEKYAKH